MMLHEQARRASRLLERAARVNLHWVTLELILVNQELGRSRTSDHRRQSRCIVTSRVAKRVRCSMMALALAPMFQSICIG